MKKKLFLGALLLGALTLNSCVDNVESDSVKSVRQAKAEQLKAKADLDKATGEAALITANAEKAVQETLAEYQKAQAEFQRALAEYQKAQAEREKAQAALINAQAESEKARAAQALANAEVAAQEAQLRLERQQAELEDFKKQLAAQEAQWERDLYVNQKLALQAKKELEDAIKAGDQDKINELETLLTNYTNASAALIQAQKDLAGKKMDLAKYEAGLMKPDDILVSALNQLYEDKNNLVSDLAAFEAALKEYENANSYEAAKAALEVAKKELGQLEMEEDYKEIAYKDAKNAADNAKFKLEDSQYAVAAKNVSDYLYYQQYFYDNSGYYLYSYSYKPVFSDTHDVQILDATAPQLGSANYGNICAKIIDNSVETIIPLFSNTNSPVYPPKTLSAINPETGNAYNASYDVYEEYYNLVPGGMDKFVTALKAYVKTHQEQALTDATTKVTDQTAIVNAIKALCDKLEPLGKAYNDAVTAENNAIAEGVTGDDLTPYTTEVTEAKEAFEAAVKDQKLVAPNFLTSGSQKLDDYLTGFGISATVNFCTQAYSREKNVLDGLVSVENAAEFTLKAAQKAVAAIEADAKALNAGNEGNLAAIKTVNETQLAKAQAKLAELEARTNRMSKESEISALNVVVGGSATVGLESYKIEELKKQIKSTTDQIADKQAEIDAKEKELASGKLDDQQVIEELKLDIADLEVQIPVLEQKVKLAKELLDAAMKSVEPEETPAE